MIRILYAMLTCFLLTSCDYFPSIDEKAIEILYLSCKASKVDATEESTEENKENEKPLVIDSKENLEQEPFLFILKKYRTGIEKIRKTADFYYTLQEVQKTGKFGATFNVLPQPSSNLSLISADENGYRAKEVKDNLTLRDNQETVTVSDARLEAIFLDTFFDKSSYEVWYKHEASADLIFPNKSIARITINRLTQYFEYHKWFGKSPEKGKWKIKGRHFYGTCQKVDPIKFDTIKNMHIDF